METRYKVWSEYELRQVCAHLLQAGKLEDAQQLVSDYHYLEEKVKRNLVDGLRIDLSSVIQHAASEHSQDSIVERIFDSIYSNDRFISDHPATLFQCIWNLCSWLGDPTTRRHYDNPEQLDKYFSQASWSRLRNRLHNWLDEKQADPNFLWIRTHRPPLNLRSGASNRVFNNGWVINCVAWSPCGELIASGSSGSSRVPGKEDGPAMLHVKSADTGKSIISAPQDDSVSVISFSPDGALLAVAANSGEISVWDIDQRCRTLNTKLGQGLRVVRFCPDGRALLCGYIDGGLHVVKLPSFEKAFGLSGHKDAVSSAAYSSDGTKLFSSSRDGTVRIWNAMDGEFLSIVHCHDSGVEDVSLSPDGRHFCTIPYADSGPSLERASESPKPVIKIWESQTGRESATLLGHEAPIAAVAFSPDGKHLASAGGSVLGNDCLIRIWSISNQCMVNSFRGHTKKIQSICYSPNGKWLCSGSWDNTVRIWDPKAEGGPGSLRQHDGNVYGLLFSPDGSRLASSAFEENRILIWDVDSGIIERELIGHEALVRCFRFSKDGRFLLSGGGSKYDGVDCKVRLWDVESGEPKLILEEEPHPSEHHGHVNPVTVVGFTPDARRIVSGHADLMSIAPEVSCIRVWDRDSGELLEAFQGDGSRAYEMTGTDQEMRRGKAMFAAKGIIRNPHTIAAWESENPLGLVEAAGKTAVVSVSDGREIGWIPTTLDIAATGSPVHPCWAVGEGAGVLIFSLEGPGSTSFIASSSRPVIRDSRPRHGLQKDNFDAVLLTMLLAETDQLRDRFADDQSIPYWVDKDGSTMLHRAAGLPNFGNDVQHLVIVLLEYGANPNARDKSGMTPLHCVAYRPEPTAIAIAEILLDHGADPYLIDDCGRTPRDVAVEYSTTFGNQMVRLFERRRRSQVRGE